MTPDQLDLARRAVADPRWRWEAGMLIGDYGPGIRFCWSDGAHLHGAAAESGAWIRIRAARIGDGPYLPDLTDAATAGVILSWLPVYSVAPVIGASSGFAVTVCGTTHAGATLGEAAVRAWLALGEGR